MAADSPAELIAVDWLYILALAIDLPLTVLLCRLLTDLSTLQSQRIAAGERAVMMGDTSPAK